MVEQAVEVVHAQVEAGQQVERILCAQILAGIVRVALRGIEAGHVAHLELGAIGPGLCGQIDQAAAQFDIAVMVVADFGDDVAGVARPDQAPVDGKFGLALTRDGNQVLVFVDQRDEADLGSSLPAIWSRGVWNGNWVKAVLAMAWIGRFTSIRVAAAIQRRMSPSVTVPTTRPLSLTTMTKPALLAEIFWRPTRIVSSAKTR
jgi:hypothetical protein